MLKILAGISVPVLVAGAFFASNQLVGAQDSSMYKQSFQANLTGSEEVPAVSTPATGKAVFKVTQDERQVDYTLSVSNLADVTMAHIHCADKGQNGPVAVPLYDSQPTAVNGVLAEGSLMAKDILPSAANCSPQIRDMAQLVQAMREGKLYVNVHSQQFPSGVVRGQIGTPDMAGMPADGQMDYRFVVTANPDGVANDKLAGIGRDLRNVKEIANGFGDVGATSIQSVQLDGDTAYLTHDLANNTGGVLVLNDIKPLSDDYRGINGAATGLVAPKGIELINDRNAIIVSDNGAKDIKVFAKDANGNVAPMFTAGLGQAAGGTRSVWDTSYDKASDTLFAAGTNGVVLVYDKFFATKGADGPTKLIIPSDSQGNKLSVNLHGIAYVPERDSLVLTDVGLAADATDGQVFTLNNVKQSSGRTVVAYRLAGSATQLGNPVDLTLDGQHLYIAEKSNDRILQFNDILGRNGTQNQAADAQISVSKPESIALYQ